MKKKSLYDIAMEKKKNEMSEDNNIIIVRKKSLISNLFDIIAKTLRLIIYVVLVILVTIGATVIINSQTREFLIEILKNVF